MADLTWRDRLALRIIAWLAAVLMTDAIDAEHRVDFKTIRTSLHLGERGL